MHYVAEWMHSITGKRALNLRAVCTKLSVFTRGLNSMADVFSQLGFDRISLFVSLPLIVFFTTLSGGRDDG